MTPADKRITELLDRWLTSIELHLKYVDLDEAAYRQIQPWPEHERPSRWVLEAAQEKVLQLKALAKTHVADKDGSFAEGLELMCFLANLVGAQNIKRFVPLADPNKERKASPLPEKTAATKPSSSDTQSTRQMPTLNTAQAARQPQEDGDTREMPRLNMVVKKPIAPAPSKRTHAKTSTQIKPAAAPSSDRAQQVVIADAVRLLKWGREWHELVELIARMAERPSAAEIRRILRTQKAEIEAQMRT